MNIKSVVLAVILGFSLFANKNKALDNQQLYSRVGLATGMLTTASGIYCLGFVDCPKKALTIVENIVSNYIDVSSLLLRGPLKLLSMACAKGAQRQIKKVQNRVERKRNNALTTIAVGLIVAGISWKYLK